MHASPCELGKHCDRLHFGCLFTLQIPHGGGCSPVMGSPLALVDIHTFNFNPVKGGGQTCR